MSGKALKRNLYLLREKNKKKAGVKNCKLEELHTIDYPDKHDVGLENCSFVEKSVVKAKQKKNMENAIKYSKTSKHFSYHSMFIKFKVLSFF